KVCEAKTDKSSIDEPTEVKLKDLPPHLEYAFLEGDNKFPIRISKNLSVEEKAALIKVLKSHKRAIAWKLSDIKGIDMCENTYLYGYSKNRKKTVKTGQTRTRERIKSVQEPEVYYQRSGINPEFCTHTRFLWKRTTNQRFNTKDG
ncbi:hypothetical protein Tco_0325508, partial [Tanacetum coccineum]